MKVCVNSNHEQDCVKEVWIHIKLKLCNKLLQPYYSIFACFIHPPAVFLKFKSSYYNSSITLTAFTTMLHSQRYKRRPYSNTACPSLIAPWPEVITRQPAPVPLLPKVALPTGLLQFVLFCSILCLHSCSHHIMLFIFPAWRPELSR